MTSRSRVRARASALAVAVAFLPLISGCDLGHPGGFTARSNSYCHQTATQISDLVRPTSTKEQMQYATDRYTLIERLVSEMTDSSLPGGTDGAQLRDHWLAPARASLRTGRDELAALRDAVNSHDAPAATARFAATLAIGTQNVDTALLHSRRLDDCADVFAPTVV